MLLNWNEPVLPVRYHPGAAFEVPERLAVHHELAGMRLIDGDRPLVGCRLKQSWVGLVPVRRRTIHRSGECTREAAGADPGDGGGDRDRAVREQRVIIGH